jgi:hypothetical protein
MSTTNVKFEVDYGCDARKDPALLSHVDDVGPADIQPSGPHLVVQEVLSRGWQRFVTIG